MLLNSTSLFSKVSLVLQILKIRKAREYGTFWKMWFGWHELGNKYWTLSVGFLYRSVLIPLFDTVMVMSKYVVLLPSTL
jgi:hypothetical protein